MKKIIGMGNALVDVLIPIEDDKVLVSQKLNKGAMTLISNENVNKIEEEFKTYTMRYKSGGSAANTIHGLAKLGAKTAYIGKTGRDDWGHFYKNDLHDAGIEPKLCFSDAPTGRAFTFISPDSERTFATYLGAAVELESEEITPDLFDGFQIFHIEGYLVQNHMLIEKAVHSAKNKGLKISLDLASFNVVETNLQFLESTIEAYVDILFANEEEAYSFTREKEQGALDKMSERCEIAIVKIGEKGSLVKFDDHTYTIPAIKANCIDTTGAGDQYAAGFLYGLSYNYAIEQCGRMGSLLAGNVVETIGARIEDSRWEKISKEIGK